MEVVLVKKKSLKTAITKAKNDVEKADITKLELELFDKKCKKFENDSSELFNEMFQKCDPKDVDKYIEEQVSVQESIDKLWISVREKLEKFAGTKINSGSDETKANFNDNIKLPRANLPSFSGNIHDWLSFRDLFRASVENNSTLSGSQKLSYLKLSLHGEAARIIQSISINDANYEIAWNLLEERYSNIKDQVFAHLKRFMQIPMIQSENAHSVLKLVDTANESIRSLELLNQKVEGFSENVLAYILLQKLDYSSKLWWERETKNNELPKVSDLISFLKKYARTLEASKSAKNNSQKGCLKNAALLTNVKIHKCSFCELDHVIYKCPKFKEISVTARIEFLKRRKLCFNCFLSHGVKKCTSKISCFKCGKKHNTLIHFEKTASESTSCEQSRQNFGSNVISEINASVLNPNAASFDTNNSSPPGCQTFVGASYEQNVHSESRLITKNRNTFCKDRKKYTFLSTAIINVKMQNGENIKVKALLDVGSQVNFLRKEIADLLGIKQKMINAPITGINNILVNVKRKLTTIIENFNGDFKKNIEFFIVDNITDLTLSKPLNVSEVYFPENILYADPCFYNPGKIDALLGADIFYELLKPNKIVLNKESIMLQESHFGWLVTGSIELNDNQSYHCGLLNNMEDVNNALTKFWKLESLGIKDVELIDDEDKALEIFNQTTCFKNGRYEVHLPWKRDWKELSSNYSVAKNRLENLIRRMKRDNSLYLEYCKILKDYLKEGIIEKISSTIESQAVPLYYIPHQVVVRKDSITTKTRIVFDASSHEPKELSLNDCLYQGANLNPNVFQLLVHFRLNKVAFLADIEKAFLQISLCERDRNAVRFLFINDMNCIEIYKFRRIIFGVNASPFLLAATIKKHIEKYRNVFPQAVQILNDCFYVDDLVSGGDDIQSAFEISKTAEQIMKHAGMHLRKWISNSEDLKEMWKSVGFEQLHLEDLKNCLHRVLGLLWNPCSDYLFLGINSLLEFIRHEKNTKRFLIMAAGRIYDPLGFVAPFTIRFKCLFQEIWQRKLSWDELLPSDISEKWNQWCREVPQLKDLQFPRYILNFCDEPGAELEIHTFSDASAKAYGAAVYFKVKLKDKVFINLVASKSRVAPLKKLSLPRLELMGALLASRLATEVKTVVNKKRQVKSFFWTDSLITLYWIKSVSKRWKTFIANRVNEIQTLTAKSSWYHCSGKDNPADMVSRGVSIDTLVNSAMWWRGPNFLLDIVPEPIEPTVSKKEYIKEINKNFICDENPLVTLTSNNIYDFIENFLNLSNNFLYIIRVLSFLFRFINNLKKGNKRRSGHLTSEELKEAEIWLIAQIQKKEFSEEIKRLSKGEDVPSSSKLKNLCPFLDEKNIVRVGGRLQNARINFCKKHPICLPPRHKLTNLIIVHFHKKHFHVGPQTLLYYIREKYWPVNGRNLCRKICHDCLTCFKAKPSTSTQLMGNLPQERVNENFVFNSTGIDFCGPFLVKYKNQRKGILNKIYVAIFVCLVTRAVHLELVTDLRTETFISCLKRFFSRRGKSEKIFTDNAQTFVGAATELKKLFNLVKDPDDELARYLSSEGIDWKFIPPKAPNFGGLWEAGVKSFKYHLKRVIGNAKLTLEEFLTITVQIEGFLNSRPLSPMSSDPNDHRVLSPGHFLIGREITSIPEPNLNSLPENKLSRWQKITKYVQSIWKLWQQDYLSNLQQRQKWLFQKNNVKIGTIVLVREDNLPPTKWSVARISNVFSGRDNKIRVVELLLPSGKHLKRSVRDVCILPSQ